MPELIVFAISITAVIIGADWLGNSATHIAKRLSLPRILIGATIVSLATTLPEIVIAGISGAEGSPEVGLGTVFGSPIVNLGLIFGILLLFSKHSVDKAYFLRTIKLFFLILLLVLILSIGGRVSPVSGFVLMFFGIVYLVIQAIIGRQEESLLERIENRFENLKEFFTQRENYHQVLYLVVGSLLLVLGAHFLVGSAVSLAQILSVHQIVIGFVIIAFGTSIPELFITFNSIVRNRVGIGVGNLFGASVLDLTFALGLVSVFNGSSLAPTNLYLAIASLVVISLISVLYVLEKASPRILGALLIIIYLGSLILFSNS